MKLTLALLLIASSLMNITLSCISIYGSAVTIPEIKKEYYKKGYHDAKTLYECSHDRSECEILKDTL